MADTIAFTLKSSAAQTLGALVGILHKAETHAKEEGVEESIYLSARLYPDMFPLVRQVQIASDVVLRGGQRLSGQEPGNTPDVEASFGELIERCDSIARKIEAFDDAALNASELKVLQIPLGDVIVPMEGRLFLSNFILPNLHFHAATAYGLLRMQGVVLGKRDFLMPAL